MKTALFCMCVCVHALKIVLKSRIQGGRINLAWAFSKLLCLGDRMEKEVRLKLYLKTI